jgi:uncharacterized membrane protein YjgN (DUF898 family)
MDRLVVAPPAWPGSLSFSGDRGEFRRLVTRGALLELITVGFYRFWLVTDIRRPLWANTHIDGDAAEYTGRAKELLVGFLFALAILMPVYLGYFLIGLEVERLKAFGSFPLLLFFYLFGQFAIYRARRYRLTRTVWRGVRFWMAGSGWSYAARAALWGVLVVLTLGLLWPWREAALERYKMRHSFYGDLQGSFEGRGWEFFKQAWWLWLLAPVAMVIFPLAPFFYAEFKAVEWRWWLNGVRFGEVRLESALRRSDLSSLYWKTIGWCLLLSIALVAYLTLCTSLTAGFGPTAPGGSFTPAMLVQSIPLLGMIGLGYLAFVLALNVVLRIYLLRDVWAKVVSSTTVHDIEAAANVSAMGDPATALGEGIADGLNVAGF